MALDALGRDSRTNFCLVPITLNRFIDLMGFTSSNHNGLDQAQATHLSSRSTTPTEVSEVLSRWLVLFFGVDKRKVQPSNWGIGPWAGISYANM